MRSHPTALRLAAVLVTAIVVVAGCTQAGATSSPTGGSLDTPPPSSPDDSGPLSGSLKVLDWAGYDAPDFWVDFQQAHPDVDVRFTIGASDADIFAKMRAGDQSDVFHPYTGWLQFYVEEGLVEEIDTSRLSNWDAVPDDFKAVGQVDGKQYFIPWDWGFSSVLYRTDKVQGEIDSWAALLDEAHSGHISMWDDGPAAVTVSTYIHGWDETAVTADQLAQAKQEWIAQRAHNLFYWAGEPELVEGMAGGDVWVAYAWQGAYATLLGQDVPVAYADPKEGRNSWVGVYGIRKGTPNLDLAYAFLDLKLAEATGQNVVNIFYYGHANEAVMAGITDPTLQEAFSIDDPAVLDQTNFTPNLTAEQRDAWTAMWAEIKAAP